MANTSKGLGKGLAALLGDDVIQAQEEKSSLYLPISQVESCASQPRKQFDPESLSDLADSIREHGIIQPLTVRKLQSGYYQIIAGERRWRAARMAGLSEVPAIVIEADDRKAMELAMIENLQREDLNPIEEAEGYQVLMSQYGMTQEETAQRVGKSRSAVANALRLLHLCPPCGRWLRTGGSRTGTPARSSPSRPRCRRRRRTRSSKTTSPSVRRSFLVKKLTRRKEGDAPLPLRCHGELRRGGRARAGEPSRPRLQDRQRPQEGAHRAGVLRARRPERAARPAEPAAHEVNYVSRET